MTDDRRLTFTLPNIEFLALTGRDAGDFLQRQTTQDVSTLAVGAAAPAAWLDARGRVRAIFRVLRAQDRFVLAIADQSAAALANEMRMYVLRSDVTLAVEPNWIALARTGDADDWHAVRDALADRTFIVAIDAHLHHLYGHVDDVSAIASPPLTVADETIVDAEPAIAAEIAAGVGSIAPAIAREFTAHMLNLDTLGAVAFDKGCYPGQEITARTEHLGTVKRRALAFTCASGALPAPGTEIVDAESTPVGRIVRAARDGERIVVLAVVELERAGAPLFLTSDGRAQLEPLERRQGLERS